MRLLSWLPVLSLAWLGCNDPTYLPQNRPLETQPAAMGGGFTDDSDLYVLPIRRPTQEERRALRDEEMRLQLPQPVPWVGLRDLELEILWTLKNLEDRPVDALFTINGGSEFGDYDPTLFVDPTADPEDQVEPPPLLGGTPITLEKGEVRSGVFREDDLAEAALDLEAIIRYPDPNDGLATPFVVLARHSSASRIGLETIPMNDVLPAMVRLQLHLSAGGHVVAEYSVRVRTDGDKLAAPTDRNLYVSTMASLPAPAGPMPPPAP